MVMRKDFEYLSSENLYFDSACQSMRPQPVIDALNEYYTKYNTCGERVKYKWGDIVDEKVDATREKLLKLLKLPSRKYFVSFTQNTTYGINLVLSQLDYSQFDQIVTSDIEHNSVFLPTMTYAKKYSMERVIVDRNIDGSIDLNVQPRTIYAFNVASNIDGRRLQNIKELYKMIHKAGSLLIIDCAQGIAHYHEWLANNLDADFIAFSAHKAYGPSLGGIIANKDALRYIDTTFIGGGMVDDVEKDDFVLSYKSPNHIHTIFESGLQSYGEIIAFGAALDWLSKQSPKELFAKYNKVYEFLKNRDNVALINHEAEPVISFYSDKIDAHLLAEVLSREGIMARSGYFCCHYYLEHKMSYPPLLRLSFGYHNSDEDIEKLLEILEKVL